VPADCDHSREDTDVSDDDVDVVLCEVDDGVAMVTLNRPDRMNAWTYELEARFFDLLDDADDDPDVRVIVVTGAGRGFCAGMDSGVLSQRANARSAPTKRSRSMTHLLTMRKLTIAAINGGCAGIGFVQALSCDVRFASSTARISSSFTRRGIPPEYGASWLLTRIVGAGHAADLLLSARTFDGVEAERVGLVNRSVPAEELVDFVLDYARDVAATCSPRAIAHTKADLLADWTRTQEQAAKAAHLVFDRPGHADDFQEGIDAFVSKRPPRFENVPPLDR
jgi:enoyl-CoA hydratase/carnithine racemase